MVILSIDDSKAVHAFLDRSLAGTKYQLVHALSAKEAFTILESGKHFDLLLLDWEMPELTGPDFLKVFRAKEAKSNTHSTPVIMLTSKNKVEDIQLMLNAGANEYIMKPFTPEILIEKIQTLIGEQAA